MNRNEAAIRTLVALSAIVPAVMISSLLFTRALPWWNDGGDWLKRVNAILGNTWPMWNQGTFQYPPLFFVLVASLSSLGEITALEVVAVVAYALIPVTTYFFVKELLNDKITALASAWLAGFTPVWFEMFGWGGYPDLLGIALLPLAFLGITRYHRKHSSVSLGALLFTSALIPVTHHLTFLIFVGVLVIWGGFSVFLDRGVLKPIGLSLAATLATFAVFRLAAGPWQFVLFNQAALYYLQTSLWWVLWMFKSAPLFAVLFASAVASAALLLSRRNLRTESLLLVSWILVPLVGTQGYLLGVALDYSRILFFVAQPFMVLAAASLAFRHDAVVSLRSGKLLQGLREIRRLSIRRRITDWTLPRQTLALFALVLTLISVFSTPVVGAVSLANVNAAYNAYNAYGDGERLQVAQYFATSTPRNAVVVAEPTIGRWIEGYSQRRVLLHEDPKYLFIVGELQREDAARAILFSYRGMSNGYAWVFDQAPYGTMSPLISLYSHGEYTDTVFVNETDSSVSWVNESTGRNYTVSLADSLAITSDWGTRNSSEAVISVEYQMSQVTVVRTVALSAGSRNVTMTFSASSNDPKVRLTGLKVSIEKWATVSLFNVVPSTGRALQVTTDTGEFRIYSATANGTFPFVYETSRPSSSVQGSVSITNEAVGNQTGLFSYDRSDLVAEYQVTYAVIPTQLGVPVAQSAATTSDPIPAYASVLNDPAFKVSYQNDRAIVLQVKS